MRAELIWIRRRDLVNYEHLHRKPAARFDSETQGLSQVLHEARARFGYGDIVVGHAFDVDFVVYGEIVDALESGGIHDKALAVVVGKIVCQARHRNGVAFNGHMIAEFAGMEMEAARIRFSCFTGLELGGFANYEGIDGEFAGI